jgi:hypothetical protein
LSERIDGHAEPAFQAVPRVNIDPRAAPSCARWSEIEAEGGEGVDLESIKSIGNFVMGLDGMREKLGRRSVTHAQLEQLAQTHDVIRNLVRYL